MSSPSLGALTGPSIVESLARCLRSMNVTRYLKMLQFCAAISAYFPPLVGYALVGTKPGLEAPERFLTIRNLEYSEPRLAITLNTDS